MKLVSWNVNGLRAVLNKGLDAYLNVEKADAYCFQEIKATPEQVGEWRIPEGYTAYWNPARRKGYSGTLILSRADVLNYHDGIGETEGDREGRVQTLEFPAFHLVNVYTPNSKRDLSRLAYRTTVWDEAFREHCSRLNARKPVVFCGDLNVAHREIDLANPKSNRRSAGFTDEERESFEKHLEAGFLDSFRLLHDQPHEYSWWSYRGGARSRNVGWRIDYVCPSSRLREKIRGAFIRQSVMGSDHCPVGIDIDL
ncbi:MAG: exodeoxyribonuclease III [Oceanipulchritudo sp.]